MVSSQINQLRTYYKGLNIAQKKEFIANLKEKLQDGNNREYKKFLNECIKKYNEAVRLMVRVNSPSPARTAQARTTNKGSQKSSNKAVGNSEETRDMNNVKM